MEGNGLSKAEKLCSIGAIDRLFSQGKSYPGAAPVKTALAYPWRAVWAPSLPSIREEKRPRCSRFLISVPKRRLKKAVERVLMRRRCREAYRLQRSLLPSAPHDIAFVYVANTPTTYELTAASIARLLRKIREKSE
ncbi:MAG: ribonuclease P protein component [Pseudoflavonifractor sp.]|nr:ribonuclease P protein component [Alloprevotella sp.]MCM1116916.1 ribonuclease P protein component [Pseudoflavonifractor sp.]